ncbi:MAG: peptidoglycan editing factor PgeF [Myxococcota bacterium]
MQVKLWTASSWSRRDIRYGFTGRDGGVSEGPFGTLNLSYKRCASPDHVDQNWQRLARTFGLEQADIAVLSQVHGDRVLRVVEPRGTRTPAGEADAMWTDRPNVLLAVRTADCVPVVLASTSEGGPIAAAHAGWRGLACGVLTRSVSSLRQAGAERVMAVVGPCISGDAYQVGQEVVDGVAATLSSMDGVAWRDASHPGRWRVDPGAAACRQLEALGVEVVRIEACTSGSQFFSHRHDGPTTGRQAGLIMRVAS